MIKTFEQFDFENDPFGEELPNKKSYIGYKGSLRDYISEINNNFLFNSVNKLDYIELVDKKNILKYHFIIENLLKSLGSYGVDNESLKKIENELKKRYS